MDWALGLTRPTGRGFGSMTLEDWSAFPPLAVLCGLSWGNKKYRPSLPNKFTAEELKLPLVGASGLGTHTGVGSLACDRASQGTSLRLSPSAT